MKNTDKENVIQTPKYKYYSLDNILLKDCQYNMIFGERSSGKTYSVLKLMLINYIATGEQGAYIRRFREDFRGRRGESLFSALVVNGEVTKLTSGEYSTITYRSGKWYLSNPDPKDTKKTILDAQPFCYGFSLSEMEHDKSTSYPLVTTICFDEFMTRKFYLNDEFILFTNVLSTIIRERDNVLIFMLANTVNKYCPYFTEMGLTHISAMSPGDIDIYTYGELEELRVAVEYTDVSSDQVKKSDKYFVFDNPKLQMITHGIWELAIYPHLPFKFPKTDIILTYFIQYNLQTCQCEIVYTQSPEKIPVLFTYIHKKTTEIRYPDDIIFTTEYSPLPNIFHSLTKPDHPIAKKISNFFRSYRVFYQDNEIGELINNYLKYCTQDSILRD